MLVNFINIQDVYSSNSEMELEISFEKGFVGSPNDWVGLFKVGWMNFEDAITSINFSSFFHNKNFIIKANYLPSFHSENLADHYFYQLCYISQNDLKGVSDIFKFTSRNKENSQKISDDTYKVIEKNKNIYNYKKIKELENQIETLTFSKENLEKSNTILKKQLNIQNISPHNHKVHDQDGSKHIYPSKEMINVTLNTSSEMDEYFSDAESFNQLYNNISRPIGFVLDSAQSPGRPHLQLHQNSTYQLSNSQASFYPQASYPLPSHTPLNPTCPPHPSYLPQPSCPSHPSHNASAIQSNIPPRRPLYPPNLPPKPHPRNNAG